MIKTQTPTSPRMVKYWGSEIIKIIVLSVPILILVGVFALHYRGTHISESSVRRFWKETGMANSEYYQFEEVRVTDDSIYFVAEDIPGEVKWSCASIGMGKSCGMSFSNGGGMPNGGNDLGGYFWGEHWSEIEDLLDKYPGLSERLQYRIEVYDLADLENFAREILEIPELNKLYQAYRSESERTNRYDAAQEFAYAYVDFMQEDGEKYDASFLFEWMDEQGM